MMDAVLEGERKKKDLNNKNQTMKKMEKMAISAKSGLQLKIPKGWAYERMKTEGGRQLVLIVKMRAYYASLHETRFLHYLQKKKRGDLISPLLSYYSSPRLGPEETRQLLIWMKAREETQGVLLSQRERISVEVKFHHTLPIHHAMEESLDAH